MSPSCFLEEEHSHYNENPLSRKPISRYSLIKNHNLSSQLARSGDFDRQGWVAGLATRTSRNPMAQSAFSGA
ncbi:hypothetical protein SCOR_17905 [Sulfidibacter corallicola]